MTDDLKPCPFCGCTTFNRVVQCAEIYWYECDWCSAAGPVEGRDMNDEPQGWNTLAPTVSDTGADSGPGASTSQPGEAPVSSAPATGWQPIATAPRDETLFLATGLDGGSGPDRHVAIVFCDGAGFFDDFDEYTYLTHWMPLPAPPVEKEGAE